MATVTKHYGISGAVEFLDVELLRDNKLFIDPRVVRRQTGPFALQANMCTTTFFDEIVGCIRSTKSRDHTRGLHLLQSFHEPRETRLGYSERGSDGHGSGEVIGEAIWDALYGDVRAFVTIGLLKLIEDMPIFVDGIAEDRTSDLTTRIIFEPLAGFTQTMIARHPEFRTAPHGVGSFDRQVWDPVAKDWMIKSLQLPVAANKPLLLVPKGWVNHRLLMTTGRYYSKTMLDWVQDQTSSTDRSTGKAVKTPKESLRKQSSFAKSMKTVIRVTRRAQKESDDLIGQFRNYVDSKYVPLSDDEIRRRIG